MAAAPGVFVVDKPAGPTSHDVVAAMRRVVGVRRAGHAGTLDPAATGVLVVAVGDATKLLPFLAAGTKRYAAAIAFGRATDTLDAEGVETVRADVPAWLLDEIGAGAPDGGRIAAAIAAEHARTLQVPPAFSAVHVEGERSHARARRGEAVSLAPRPVAVEAIEARAPGPGAAGRDVLRLDLVVRRGYYVRSLARDLGEALGVPAHLASLRRTASGPFAIDEAIAPDAGRDAMLARRIPPAEAAARVLPVAALTDDGARRARHGKLLVQSDFAGPVPPAIACWIDPAGSLVAVGSPAEGGFAVVRGFAPP